MIYKFRQEYVYEEYGVIIYEIRWYKGSRWILVLGFGTLQNWKYDTNLY